MEPGRTALVGTFGPRSADELTRLFAAREAARCDLIELRLDLVPGVRDRLADLIAAAPAPVVATCRRHVDGGGFMGSEVARLRLLHAAARSGAAWVDVESDVSDGDVPDAPGVRVIRSTHIERLPEDPIGIVERLLAPPADVGKLVVREGGERDALRLMRLIASNRGRLAGHLVQQRYTRFASFLLGAPVAYAALRPGGRIGLDLPTVPEFLDHADLCRARWGTRAWVLLGGDVEQSVSPQMLNLAFTSLGMDVVALRWSCADARPALDALTRFGGAGAAITIPHKQSLGTLLATRDAEIGDAARATGAVNTVLLRYGDLAAENTDVAGILDALAGIAPASLDGAAGLVIGAGGAARAGVLAIRRLGGRPVVFARRPEAADSLRAVGADEIVADAEAACATAPLVVLDATPAGPPGGEPVFDPALLPRRAVILDMLVAARPTALLAAASAAGHVAVPGMSMLAHQAARQVVHMGAARPDADAMFSLGMALLEARARPVVLIGLRCSGKTAVGRHLALLSGRMYVDTDDEIERLCGTSPDALIRAGEEERLRTIEADALRALAGRTGLVVATGGGAALSGDALASLCDGAHVVLLDAALGTLLARLSEAPRARLTELSLAAELQRQRDERMATYEALATRSEDTSTRAAVEVAEALAAWLDRESGAALRPVP